MRRYLIDLPAHLADLGWHWYRLYLLALLFVIVVVTWGSLLLAWLAPASIH